MSHLTFHVLMLALLFPSSVAAYELCIPVSAPPRGERAAWIRHRRRRFGSRHRRRPRDGARCIRGRGRRSG